MGAPGQPGKVARVTTAGVITEFSVPTAASRPDAITTGADGNLWLTYLNKAVIARVTTAGVFTEFAIPSGGISSYGVARGVDDNVWFTEQDMGKVASVTAAGVVTEYAPPTASSDPVGITRLGVSMWFVESSQGQLASITALAPPTITNINPNTGGILGGTSVTITGTSFTMASTVHFGGTLLQPASVTVVDPQHITLSTPALGVGSVDVSVTTAAGTATVVNGFTYTLFGGTLGAATTTPGMPIAGHLPLAAGQVALTAGHPALMAGPAGAISGPAVSGGLPPTIPWPLGLLAGMAVGVGIAASTRRRLQVS